MIIHPKSVFVHFLHYNNTWVTAGNVKTWCTFHITRPQPESLALCVGRLMSRCSCLSLVSGFVSLIRGDRFDSSIVTGLYSV